MIIKTRQEAIQVVNSIIERLKSLYGLDDMLDDGCDSQDWNQNRRYASIDSVISSIHEELAGYDFEFMPSSECDRIWKEAWNGDKSVPLPEVKYNHAIEYANRLLAIWEN